MGCFDGNFYIVKIGKGMEVLGNLSSMVYWILGYDVGLEIFERREERIFRYKM